MHKTGRRRGSEKVVKRLSVYLPSGLGSVGHASSRTRAEMPHQALSLWAITAKCERDSELRVTTQKESRYAHLSFSLLMQLHPGD